MSQLESFEYGTTAAKLTLSEVRVARAANKESDVVRLYPKLHNYAKAKAASGKTVLDNGDPVAVLLRGCTTDGDLWQLAELHLGPVLCAELAVKYAGRNAGMIRMNVGNRLRAAFRRAQALAALS